MKTIKLDASSWKSSQDFYAAILPALGAPDWHGENVNALVESIVWGEINSLEPPFSVEIAAADKLPPEVADEVRWTAEDVQKAKFEFQKRYQRKIEVDFKIVS